MTINRFCVMATLQAARAYNLGLPLESALSWGLNRAIFYAAAKRGFKGRPGMDSRGTGTTKAKEEAATYHLGDEMAYKEEKGGKIYFTIGGETQTAADFERQIESRFSAGFEGAWQEALDYVQHFDKETLLSAKGFFETVYRPKRDELAEKWTELAERKTAQSRKTQDV